MSKRPPLSTQKPEPADMLARAAAQLMAGDALAAQRTARTTEQLMLLEARLQRRAETSSAQQDQRAHALDARQRELDARHAALNQREFDVACEAQRLEDLKESLEAIYAQMYNKEAE